MSACQNVTDGARESRIPSLRGGRWRISPYFRGAGRVECQRFRREPGMAGVFVFPHRQELFDGKAVLRKNPQQIRHSLQGIKEELFRLNYCIQITSNGDRFITNG